MSTLKSSLRELLSPWSRTPVTLVSFWILTTLAMQILKTFLSKIPPRAKVIKAVTNSSFGLSREDALMTYRATVEPIIN